MVIYCNIGYREFAKYSIQSVNDEIVVLTDMPEKYEHSVDLSDYKIASDRISRKYIHMNSNPVQFELPCFLRWFIIREFIEKNNINNFMVSDWDVLYACDLKAEQEKYRDYDFTFTGSNAGSSMWNGLNGIKYYTDIMEQTYSEPESGVYKNMASIWEQMNKSHSNGGICDMTFLDWMKRYSSLKMVDVSLTEPAFDAGLNGLDGWQSAKSTADWKIERDFKDIKFRNKEIYCYHTGRQREVRLNSIHCWGKKNGIEEYYKQIQNS